MTLDVTVDSEAEEVVIVLDDHKTLKATKGSSSKDLILNKNFKALEEEDEKLFRILKILVTNLFSLE